MISKINSPVYYKKPPTFKGYKGSTFIAETTNSDPHCIHQTSFFRNCETLEFTADYIAKNFPNGTNIAGFGCSDGEEEYSLAMLLKKHNSSKKYKIKGYDISPKVIQKANGPFNLEDTSLEDYISRNSHCEKENKKELKQLFLSSFERLPKSFVDYYHTYKGSTEDLEKEIDKKISTETDVQKLLRYKCYKEILCKYAFSPTKDTFIPKIKNFEGILDFQVADIHNISNIIKPDGDTGVIVFKNAWYHLLGSRGAESESELSIFDVERTKKVINDISKILPKKGILVVGNLKNDHLIFYGQRTNSIIQDGKEINAYNETFFHQMLKRNGFKPIFYEQIKTISDECDESNIYLPSVWEKT